MAGKGKPRIPKKDDRVTARGQNGVVVIYGIDSSLRTVELKQIGGNLAPTQSTLGKLPIS